MLRTVSPSGKSIEISERLSVGDRGAEPVLPTLPEADVASIGLYSARGSEHGGNCADG
jgi:hypothetical protein